MNQHDLGRIALGASLGVVGGGRDTVSEARARSGYQSIPSPLEGEGKGEGKFKFGGGRPRHGQRSLGCGSGRISLGDKYFFQPLRLVFVQICIHRDPRRTGGWLLFLASPRKSNQKEGDPGSPPCWFPSRLGQIGRCATRAARSDSARSAPRTRTRAAWSGKGRMLSQEAL